MPYVVTTCAQAESPRKPPRESRGSQHYPLGCLGGASTSVSSATFFLAQPSWCSFPYEMKRSFSEKDTEDSAEDEEKHLLMKRCVISDISLYNMANSHCQTLLFLREGSHRQNAQHTLNCFPLVVFSLSYEGSSILQSLIASTVEHGVPQLTVCIPDFMYQMSLVIEEAKRMRWWYSI